MGGDASLLHLISLIDSGIKRRMQFKDGERAEKFRKIYRIVHPFKVFFITIYVLLT